MITSEPESYSDIKTSSQPTVLLKSLDHVFSDCSRISRQEGEHLMTKAERLAIEKAARAAVGRKFGCDPQGCSVRFPGGKPVHEFDVYADGVVIGGVSTSPLTTGGGSRNTGGCDRACSELLWLSLWPGTEERVHVLTDLQLAEWLVNRYRGAVFPRPITIYHYDQYNDKLAEVGTLLT